jgi:uncharacterized protein YerC
MTLGNLVEKLNYNKKFARILEVGSLEKRKIVVPILRRNENSYSGIKERVENKASR